MATLEWKYKRDGEQDLLLAYGNYLRGWQKWKDGRGYFGRALIPYKNGISFCLDVQILGKSRRDSQKAEPILPPSGNWTLKFSFGKAVFLEGDVALHIPAQRCVELTHDRPKHYLRENLPGFFSDAGSLYRVVIAVQIKGESAKKTVVSWEAGQPMTFSGGLPETNRRRH